jgi:hypothetical protein
MTWIGLSRNLDGVAKAPFCRPIRCLARVGCKQIRTGRLRKLRRPVSDRYYPGPLIYRLYESLRNIVFLLLKGSFVIPQWPDSICCIVNLDGG